MTVAFILGHCLGYALMLAANHALDPFGFGLFYTAWVAITVTMAPATAILLVLGRVLTSAVATLGREAVARLTLRLLRACLLWGLPAAMLSGAALAGAGAFISNDAEATLLLIPLVTLALILVELLRTSFQALLRFGWSSALWLASQSVQVGFAIPALALWHSAWPGFAAVLVGATLACIGFVLPFARAARHGTAKAGERLPLHLGREVRLVASYSLFVVISNMDILLGYGLLPREALSVYAASAMLPKAIVLVTLPVAQIVLPIIVEQQADGRPTRQVGLTAVALVLGMGGAAGLVLWLVVPAMQSTPIAIHGLDLSVMKMLTLGSVGLGTARVLVTAEIALGRYSIGYLQGGVIALFAALVLAEGYTPWSMATIYTIVCWVLCASAAAVLMSGLIRPRPRRDGTERVR